MAAIRTVIFLVLGALGGCGYSTTQLFPKKFESVAIAIFHNNTFYRSLEFDLTEAIVKQIELETPYAIVPRGTAQTLLEGTIVKAQQHRLSRQRVGGVPQELEFQLVVDFQWKDLQTGKLIRDRKGLMRVGRYIPTAPLREPLAVAQHQASQSMAEAVISVMRADW